MIKLFTIRLTQQIKIQGAYGELTVGHIYAAAESFEAALVLFAAKYPDARVKGIDNIDYYNGTPVLGLE